VVRRVRLQPARADDAAVREVGVLVQRRLEAREDGAHVGGGELRVAARERAVHVHVRPRPQLIGGRQRGGVGDVDVRQRLARDVPALLELHALLEDHEHDPRAQLEARPVGRGGRVAPGEVLVVELDRRHVVGLVVGDPVARLGAHDRPAVDAHDVAGAVQLHVAVDVRGRRRRDAGQRLAGQRQLHVDRRALVHVGVVVLVGDLPGEPLAEPGQERVGGERARHATASNEGMTCSARLGFAASWLCRCCSAIAWLANIATGRLSA
jgi:hypothetical protein